MLNFFRLLVLLINVDQEVIPDLFGLLNENGSDLNLSGVSIDSSSAMSLNTLQLTIAEFMDKMEDGLYVEDVESIVHFILFVRFLILTVKYNLKTSLIITFISIFAGLLWYRHLMDVIAMYRSIIVKIPSLSNFVPTTINIPSNSTKNLQTLNVLELGETIHWYNPGKLLYHAFVNGIKSTDPKTSLVTYIDPLSMIISKLRDVDKAKILATYYTMYDRVLPSGFKLFSELWGQFAVIAAYALITRLGKRFCPYLIRWHWTFVLMITIVEQVIVFFVYRVYYFQTFVLFPKFDRLNLEVNVEPPIGNLWNILVSAWYMIWNVNTVDKYGMEAKLFFDLNFSDSILSSVISSHIGFVIFALLHAACGQYFYVFILVDNIELHVGQRPLNSIYSAGKTPWQDPAKRGRKFKDLPMKEKFSNAFQRLLKIFITRIGGGLGFICATILTMLKQIFIRRF